MKSKAAILVELNKPLVIDEVEIPKLDVGQILVKIRCSSICGSQVGEMIGAKGEDPHLPHLMGHEGGGEVMDTGPGVRTIKAGDRVVLHWRKGEGIESDFPKYKLGDREIGAGLVATFTQYAVVSENRITKVQDNGIPFDVMALLGCGVTTGLGLINNEAKVKIGQSVLVLGCGGVGMSVVLGAKLASARRIVVVEKSEYRRAMSKKFGATHTLSIEDTAGEGAERWLFLLERGFDVAIDSSGVSEVIDFGYSAVRPGGRMVLVGQPRYGDAVTFSNMYRNYRGKILLDSQGGLTNPAEDIPNYIWLYSLGPLRCLDWLITHRFPLERINDAVELMRGGDCGRVALDME